MKTISYTFEDSEYSRLVSGITARNGYRTTIPDPNDPNKQIPNPESPEKFTERMGTEYFAGETDQHEKREAAKQATATIVPIKPTGDTKADAVSPSVADVKP